MKKLYRQAKWKKYSLRKMKQKRRPKGLDRNTGSRGISNKKFRKLYRRKVEIEAPRVFSLIKNPEETLSFFSMFHDNVKANKWTHFNLENIEEITPDTILYMISKFKYYQSKLKYNYYSGNWPIKQECKDLLLSSGFDSHIKTKQHVQHNRLETLEIRYGDVVDGRIVKDIIMFVRKHLQNPDMIKMRQLYETIIECMMNTVNHAYGKKGKYTRWLVMAYHEENSEKVNFTFVDNGYGIPQTINKKIFEKIQGYIGGSGKDHKLITSALNGEFRTRTKLGHRGKGLPRIQEHCDNKVIDDLFILSNNAYINASGDERYDLSEKFNGTLFSWNFI